APPSLSVVCFRAAPKGVDDRLELDALNADLLERVNGSGEVYLSATRLREAMALRLAVGNIRTNAAHVARAWEIIRTSLHTAARRGLDSHDTNHER
ncbi:MAG TPA: hypothetical protein VFU59_00295, partial [Candidatus Eisenbacteria bacterium]|nr:hypothetical protein [Candidatus Eisenbacteria bacterium]